MPLPIAAGAAAIKAQVAARVAARGARAALGEVEGASGGRGRGRGRGRRRRERKRPRSRLTMVLVALFTLLVLTPMMLSVYLTIEAVSTLRDQALASVEIAGMAGATAQAMLAGGCPLPPAEMAAKVAAVDGIAAPATIEPAFEAYCSAAEAYELDWALLAGIGRMECFHGTSLLAGCNPDLHDRDGTRRTNGDGARGPMQFLGSTWRTSAAQHDPEVAGLPVPEGQERLGGYATDGSRDRVAIGCPATPDPPLCADPWEFLDAAHAAARYLVALGGQTDPARAAFGYYNGGGATFDPGHFYHQGVLRHADAYRRVMPVGAKTVPTPGGAQQTTVEGITVHVAIAEDVGRLVRAAHAAGIPLSGDGFRSHQAQIDLRRAHCGPSHYDIYEKPSGQCSPPTAIPGTSNHERGLAIDFECGGNGNYIPNHSSPCFRWLATNAATYGLYNLPSEPWHWSVDGS